MNIKSGLKFMVGMWGAIAAVFIVGWVALKVGIMIGGYVGAMASLGVLISVFLFLLGALV